MEARAGEVSSKMAFFEDQLKQGAEFFSFNQECEKAEKAYLQKKTELEELTLNIAGIEEEIQYKQAQVQKIEMEEKEIVLRLKAEDENIQNIAKTIHLQTQKREAAEKELAKKRELEAELTQAEVDL